MTKDEILTELRELLEACWVIDCAKEVRGMRHVTPVQWKSFQRSYRRASEFIQRLDGPKVETGCICHNRTPGESIMGRPCPLHRT